MIPRTIHYCWFGKAPKSELVNKCMATWRNVLPNYRIREWNDGNCPITTEYERRAYSEQLWAYISDYVRLNALYAEGGIYLDTDVEVLKTLDPFLENDCFLGFQRKKKHTNWVNNAVMGSLPGNPFLRECMELTLGLFNETNAFHSSPFITTRILKQMGLKRYGMQKIGDVQIYPFEYFYPYSWLEEFSPECIKDNTHCIHHWAGSWIKDAPSTSPGSLLSAVIENAFKKVKTFFK